MLDLIIVNNINKDQKGKRMHRTFHEKFRAEKLEKIL